MMHDKRQQYNKFANRLKDDEEKENIIIYFRASNSGFGNYNPDLEKPVWNKPKSRRE